jgi:hypothetical protein
MVVPATVLLLPISTSPANMRSRSCMVIDLPAGETLS